MGGKGSGRTKGATNKIDPFDPNTWPADSKRRLEREMQIKDVLMGHKVSTSPKKQWIRERTAHRPDERINVSLHPDILDTVADIQAMHKLGTFRFLPLSVRETFFPNGKIRPPIRLRRGFLQRSQAKSLEDFCDSQDVFGNYETLSYGTRPYMSRAMRNYLSVDLHKIGMKRMVNSVHRAAEFDKEFDYEDDDDFDLPDCPMMTSTSKGQDAWFVVVFIFFWVSEVYLALATCTGRLSFEVGMSSDSQTCVRSMLLRLENILTYVSSSQSSKGLECKTLRRKVR